jgi:hypothetical protein
MELLMGPILKLFKKYSIGVVEYLLGTIIKK